MLVLERVIVISSNLPFFANNSIEDIIFVEARVALNPIICRVLGVEN